MLAAKINCYEYNLRVQKTARLEGFLSILNMG